MGTEVCLQKPGEKAQVCYTLVGSEEANIHESKLSYLSPLGEALMGKSKGDEIEYETPTGKQKYKLLKFK